MASLKAQRATFPQPMRVDGTAVNIADKYVLTATNPAAADTIDFRIPAGSYVCDMKFVVDDIDTGATSVFGVGYRAVDTSSTLTPSTTYFAAAGQTTGQAGGTLVCAFKPRAGTSARMSQDIRTSTQALSAALALSEAEPRGFRSRTGIIVVQALRYG